MDSRNVTHALLELECDPMEHTVVARYGQTAAGQAPASANSPAPGGGDCAQFDNLDLLANSGLLTPTQLLQVERVCLLTAYPVGTVALEMDYISHDQLLHLRELEKAAATRKPRLLKPMPEGGPGSRLRLGELLEAAELIDTRELSIALSLSAVDTRRIGQIMVSSGFLTEEALQLALECQSAVARCELTSDLATNVLKHCVEQGCSIPEGIFDLGYSHDATIIAFM